MVALIRCSLILAVGHSSLILLAEKKIGLDKLDGPSRAKVLAALAGLVILGVGLMALAWLGARVTRRYMNPAPFRPQRIHSSPDHDDWASKPLIETIDGEDGLEASDENRAEK